MKRKILLFVGIVLAFLILSYGFVPQVLGGKILNQNDISVWIGMSKETLDWNESHPDDETAWTESMFGGMPTTIIRASTKGDWIQPLYDLFLIGKRPATYLFISLLGAFLMMLSLGISPLVAAGGAVAVTFCAYNIQILQVGHNTKMQALAFLPWVLAALIFTFKSALGIPPKEECRKAAAGSSWLIRTILGAGLFGLTMSFQVKANHPQITYYLALMILLYAVTILIWMLAKSERRRLWKRFLACSALLLVIGCVGIGTNAIKLLPTWEYTSYSIRGGSSATAEGAKKNKGLDLDYATEWSYGWEELPNLMIPNYNGGASVGAVNPAKSHTYKLMKRNGQINLKEASRNLPLYWGPQPITAGPMYMGAVTIFLFILGLMYCRSKEKWWAVIVSVLAVFLSLGYHFMWMTRLFYDILPLYNKFRTVSMSLVVLQFTLPLLGFFMLDRFVKGGLSERQVLLAGGVSAGLCLLLALMQSIFGTFSGEGDVGMPKEFVNALSVDRRHLMWADTWRSLLLVVTSTVLLLWGSSVPGNARKTFVTQPAAGLSRRRTAALLVCVVALLDVFVIGKRYLGKEDFVTPRDFAGKIRKRPVDEMILKDSSPSFRVMDLTVEVFNNASLSYWHKNIGGTSPAKLQIYQEFIDKYLNPEISRIYDSIDDFTTVEEAEAELPFCPGLAAMNCRYIIVGDNAVLRYPYARGSAWFDTSSENSSPDCPESLMSFPFVRMVSYAPNSMEYRYSSPSDGTLVFSEVYYPEGWTLTIDGKEDIPIELYDGVVSEDSDEVPGGILRCAKVPSGRHTLVMRFSPASYVRGEALSRTCSIILIIMLLASLSMIIISQFRQSCGEKL